MQIQTTGSASSVKFTLPNLYLGCFFPNVEQRWRKGLVVGIQMQSMQTASKQNDN